LYEFDLVKIVLVKLVLDLVGSSDKSIPTIKPKIDGIAKRLPQESQPKGAHHFAKPNKVNTIQRTANETSDF
jgi:5,10-methenyltetrahydromethanopterin hydrogenase